MFMSNFNSSPKKGPSGGGVPPNKKGSQPPANGNNWWYWLIFGVILFVMLSQTSSMQSGGSRNELTYSTFYQMVASPDQAQQITELTLEETTESKLTGTLTDGTTFRLNIPKDDKILLELIRKNVNNFKVIPPQTFWSQVIFSFLPILLLIFFIWFISYRGSQVGNRIWSFGKSRAKMNNKDMKVTFKNVSGVDEAKEELQEVIEFLKDPKKFERLGGKIPKGVLLVGPPGTGKTLLAKAVAGEAGVPFYSLSGSDFVEMFVGVGASRVRDLFEQGRKASMTSGKGAIIFIDEIDAVGRLRFTGIGGGNDEREQTLNALLVEMDGFNTQGGLIVIAATNRPDTLDPALLRPGRFDRQVTVALPDINGREGILKVHSKKIKVADDVDYRKIAQQTVYFSGADLANVCNEAALLAARNNKESVGMKEFYDAVERVTMGPEKKSPVTSTKEKTMTAYHEAGHALLSLYLDEVDTFTKVSIIPRGMAGGYTLTPPTEDRHYMNKKELLGQVTVLLGGLVAEELYVGVTSTGVSNDLQKVAGITRAMICQYGMSDTLGKLAYGQNQNQRFLGRDIMDNKDISESTAAQIDKEVHAFVDQCYRRAKTLLNDNRDHLDLIAKTLVEREVIDIHETRQILGIPEPDVTDDEVLAKTQTDETSSDKPIDDSSSKDQPNDSDDTQSESV